MRKRLLTFAVLLLPAAFAVAQRYPMPAKATAADVLCALCQGTNEAGQSNDGKITPKYDAPLLAHVGRIVDSNATISVQNSGMRTVRARAIRMSPATNRIYMGLGETVGAYKLDTFFTGKLQQPMVDVTALGTGQQYGGRSPFEKLAAPDSFFYAEADQSGWSTSLVDSQKHLNDFDADDRGYVYVSTVYFGWGIAYDSGTTRGTHMTYVTQQLSETLEADAIFSLRRGGVYYAVVSDGRDAAAIFDVTTPSTPKLLVQRDGSSRGITRWAKYPAGKRIAVLNADGRVRVYSNDSFVESGLALKEITPAAGKRFNDLTFDDAGNLWLAESTASLGTNYLMKVSDVTGKWTEQRFDVYGGTFMPEKIHAAGGYIVVGGREQGLLGALPPDVRLFQDGPTPVLIDTSHFFRRYYHAAPAGYANPFNVYMSLRAVHLVQQGAKTYLIYNANGLGDAYEIPTIAPAVTAMTPVSGPAAGGTVVTIEGHMLPEDATVTFDGIAAQTTRVSPTRITAVAPPHVGGAVEVVVTTGSTPHLLPQKFTYSLGTPAHFAATLVDPATIDVRWDAVAGATTYELSRRDATGGWTIVQNTESRRFVDEKRTAGRTYIYRVRALDAAGAASPYVSDLATTVAFTESSIGAGQNILAAHVIELRQAVNATRAAANLSTFPFPDDVGPGKDVRASTFTSLHLLLSEARSIAGLGTPQFSPVLPGTNVLASHLRDLKALVE